MATQTTTQPLWQRIAMRTFGALNLADFCVGLPLTLLQTAMIGAAREASGPTSPYVMPLFLLNVAINFACLFMLFWVGIGLVRMRTDTLRVCARLYVAELLRYLIYQVIAVTAIFLPNSFNQSASQIPAVGGGALGPQIFTGFPIIGLLAIYITRRQLQTRVFTSGD